MSPKKSGSLIVFEGTEKVGKHTQANKLVEAIKQICNQEPLSIIFPDTSTPLGKLIERYEAGELELDPHAAHLLYTANRWERHNDIRNALKAGQHVIIVRYTYTSIVSTAAKINPLPEVEWQWLKDTETGFTQPDIVFCLISEDFHELNARSPLGKGPFMSIDFQQRELNYYARLANDIEKADGTDQSVNGDSAAAMPMESDQPRLWNWINATGSSPDIIHECIMKLVDSKI